ncbi:MAG: universal stress protein [Polyangiaceae bacterium]|nr:universal stress protein [Polyangiaceae bacterium]
MSLFQRILVPVAFDASTPAAIELACRLATELGATVDLLHVIDVPESARADLESWAAVTASRAYASDYRGEVEARLRRLADDLAPRLPRPAATHVLVGDPAATIVHHARERRHDLVVMGAHGRTGVARVFLGSVAERVTRRAPCAVLTVRGAGAEADAGSEAAA